MIKNAKILIILLIYFSLIRILFNTISADESYISSKKALSNADVKQALIQANKSILKNPSEPRYYYNRAKVYIATGNKSDKQKALSDLKKAEELNPKNLVTLRNNIPVYYLLSSEIEVNDETYKVFKKLVENYYIKMGEYSKTDVGLFALLYKYENKMGLNTLAKQSENRINELRPDLFEWYIKD